MSVNQTTREERVAGLVGALRLTAQPFPSSIDAWLLITVEALAGLGEHVSCPICHLAPRKAGHHKTCTVGIASEAWRRFTQKGEHGGT